MSVTIKQGTVEVPCLCFDSKKGMISKTKKDKGVNTQIIWDQAHEIWNEKR